MTTRQPPTRSQTPGGQPAEAAAAEDGYVHWIYLGAESVFFYPPGSEREHLVIDHGIPSVDMHWQVKGRLHDHAADHRRQQRVTASNLGDLPAVTHTHEPTTSRPSFASG
jgi:hypothetical protein